MRIDLTGKRFGRWTVIGFGDMEGRSATQQSVWRCRCDCGVEKGAVLYGSLVKGVSQSCGCLRKERLSRESSKGRLSVTMKREYIAWLSMKTRCYNVSHPTYAGYGARGITVCDEWRYSFEAFLKDVGPRPDGDYSLERLDNAKGYTKENCVWASRLQQNRNKHRIKFLEWNGMSMTLTEICRRENIDYCSAYQSLYTTGRSLEGTVSIIKGRGLTYKERAKGMM